MQTLATYGAVLLAFAGVIWAMIRGATAKGRAEANLDAQQRVDRAAIETSEKTVEEIKDASLIRDRLDADPTYRERVRRRFTRKDS